MKVTAFHMVNKVEEAARSYFSNSLLFGSQTVLAERTVNFRRGQAAVQFFIDRGEDAERLAMGGLEFEAVQDRDNKVAFQCRLTVQPSGESKQFFLMVTANREPYSQYTRLVDLLRVRWERQMQAYLPLDEDGQPMLPEQPAIDDEYEGLTDDEIEAVTGSRPAPKGSAAPQPAPAAEPVAGMTEDEIQRLMGLALVPEADGPESGEAPSGMMSLDEIEALTREFNQPPAEAPKPAKGRPPPNPKTAEAETELSAEDIWKQITGGKG